MRELAANLELCDFRTKQHMRSCKRYSIKAAMRGLCVFRKEMHFAPAGKADGSYVLFVHQGSMYEELGTAMYQLSVIPLLVRVIWRGFVCV